MDGNRFSVRFLSSGLVPATPLLRTLLPALMVLTVLALHVGFRWRANDERQPAASKSLYPHCYSRSISLVVGCGYERLPLADDAPSEPIKQFLDCRTPTLSTEALQTYLASLPTQRNPDLGNFRQVDVMRAGDLYTAAIVWKVFGVSWLALSRFYIFVSALACLAIFFAAKRISGSFVAGLTAAMLYAACPYELSQVMRDTAPIWFIAFATLVLTLSSGRQTTIAYLCGGLLLGAVSVLGFGWRPQVLFFAPFFLAASLFRHAFNGASWRQLTITTATFLVGAGVVYAGLSFRGDASNGDLMSSGFHVAYSGEQNRAAAAGAENDLQITFDDSKVAADVFAYCSTQGLKSTRYCDVVYSAACRTLYFEAMRHHLYYWTRSLPTMIHLVVSGKPIGNKANVWQLVAPWFFFIGLMALFSSHVDRTAFALLLAIMAFYFGIWFGISPESRHWGVFLVPVCIIGGNAPTIVVRAWRQFSTGEWRHAIAQRRTWYLPAAASACVVLWIGACVLAFNISSEARADYWSAIQTEAESAVDVVDGRRTSQSFAVDFAEGTTVGRGYLVEIQAGANPQELFCKHLRTISSPVEPAHDWGGNPPGSGLYGRQQEAVWWNAFLETRHRLAPNKKQVFFVTCRSEPSGGDTRSYSLKVTMSGDAKITGVREFDLASWRRLPMSTVFQLNDSGPTPYVDGVPTRNNMQFEITPKMLAELGFNDAVSAAPRSNTRR
jgi:hypothetical protein